MLQSPLRVFMQGHAHGALGLPCRRRPPSIDHRAGRELGPDRAQEGLLSAGEPDRRCPTLRRKGLQLLVDGIEPNRLREVLEVEIGVWENQMKMSARKVWEAAGGYAPTIGISAR